MGARDHRRAPLADILEQDLVQGQVGGDPFFLIHTKRFLLRYTLIPKAIATCRTPSDAAIDALRRKFLLQQRTCLCERQAREPRKQAAGSPYPRSQRRFDLTCPSGKNS